MHKWREGRGGPYGEQYGQPYVFRNRDRMAGLLEKRTRGSAICSVSYNLWIVTGVFSVTHCGAKAQGSSNIDDFTASFFLCLMVPCWTTAARLTSVIPKDELLT